MTGCGTRAVFLMQLIALFRQMSHRWRHTRRS